ncbi:hypothetical protein [Sunxiuqinia elliptica]|uniref:Uncharacterized protein n=1 Tax=Sunxiuqinia elliptica TaxID=655355 RepID=A0A1I2GP53_9BACT|nr:hypothetical protein [Sunxiuqinia elliptica]SFF19355.1 hypothetical protein SAMN05216283_10365 [Sunxiuqinia elliptica]
MAHTLKLHIWKVLLKPSMTKQKDVPNEMLLNRIKAINGTESGDPYIAFAKGYIESFNGRFAKNRKRTKSFAPIVEKIYTKSNQNLIYGFLQGGPTGIEQYIKPNSDYKRDSTDVGVDDVVNLDYYFHFWIPADTNYAYIMLQSYSEVNRGIAGPFFEHLHEFLGKYGYIMRGKEPKVPKPIKEMFMEESVIIGMDIIKDRTSPADRKRFNQALHESEKAKFKLSVSGISMPFSWFQKHFKMSKRGNPFFIDLSELGITDPNDYIANVRYRDPITNTSTQAKLSDLLNIRPTIVLPESVKKKGSEYPDLDKVFVFCNQQLQMLLLEEKYATVDEYQG